MAWTLNGFHSSIGEVSTPRCFLKSLSPELTTQYREELAASWISYPENSQYLHHKLERYRGHHSMLLHHLIQSHQVSDEFCANLLERDRSHSARLVYVPRYCTQYSNGLTIPMQRKPVEP